MNGVRKIYPPTSPDAWRNNLPARCPHVPDTMRNPDRRANLCLHCRRDAGDPYAARITQQRYGDNELARRRESR